MFWLYALQTGIYPVFSLGLFLLWTCPMLAVHPSVERTLVRSSTLMRTFPMLAVHPGLPEERTLVRESTSPSATLKRCAESRPFVSRMPSTAEWVQGPSNSCIPTLMRPFFRLPTCLMLRRFDFSSASGPLRRMGSAACNFKSSTFRSPPIGNTNGRTGYESSRWYPVHAEVRFWKQHHT